MVRTKILNSTNQDIDTIFSMYAMATELQRSKLLEHIWPEFDRDMVLREIEEDRQFKLLLGGHVACVWAITFQDLEIWGEKDNEPSMYIHRIATHPDYRGHNLVSKLVAWAKFYARSKHKTFVRLDTCGFNEKLIRHYTDNGFNFLGTKRLTETERLPAHYHNADVCLFEMKVKD